MAKKNLRWLDITVLCAYATAVLTAVAHHEPWGDEAQAWLLARDLPLSKLIFSEMHYEVSPGLWHVLLWFTQHIFHAPYGALNWVGAGFGICGAAILIFLAPFPRIIRYTMASSFFLIYQYAVVARPYVMLMLFGGLAAVFYRRRNPVYLVFALVLLSSVSLHGMILAAALAIGATGRALSTWPSLNQGERGRYLCSLGIYLVAIIAIVIIAYPAPDVNAYANASRSHTNLMSTVADIFPGPWFFGILILVLLGAFSVWREELLVYVLGVGGLLFFHIRIYGGPHHEGAIVVAIVVALWVSWPNADQNTPAWFLPVSIVILCGVFGLQTVWAVSAIRHDLSAPYSGSKDVATYLREVGADRLQTVGLFFSNVAVNAYFDHNIFVNWPTAYVHQSLAGSKAINQLDFAEPPDFVVVGFEDGSLASVSQELSEVGYYPVHVSPGSIFFKQGIWRMETFVVYKRSW